MKRIFVNRKWCLGCHLCEYNCAFANSGAKSIIKALKDRPVYPCIHVEQQQQQQEQQTFALACRQCSDPLCVKSCISGALQSINGVMTIDHDKCVSCYTCIAACPYGAITLDADGAAHKCELCTANGWKSPACVAGCPNGAIVFEERD